jgi:hypothetical protein
MTVPGKLVQAAGRPEIAAAGLDGDGLAAAAVQWRALAPVLAARGRMRLSYDAGRSYPRKLERGLTREPPPCPAAVHIYDDRGETRVLAADFDVKRAAGRGAADPVAQVAADAAALAALVRACGGRGFGDVSPNGGRHGYLLWAAPLPFSERGRRLAPGPCQDAMAAAAGGPRAAAAVRPGTDRRHRRLRRIGLPDTERGAVCGAVLGRGPRLAAG